MDSKKLAAGGLAVISAALAGWSAVMLPGWLGQWQFARAVKAAAHVGVKDCGAAKARRNSGASLECARRALAAGTPFRVVLQGPFGADTQGAQGLVVNGDAVPRLITVRYDNEWSWPRVADAPCPAPGLSIRPPSVTIACRTPGSPASGAVR